MNTLDMIFRTLYRAFGPQYWWPAETRLEVAVGAILTQNTNWSNVEKAISNLKSARMLSAKALNTLPDSRLAGLIRPAGYFNIKTKRLKNFIHFLMKEYQGSMKKMTRKDLDEIRQQLLAVNGLGPETADSIILYALEKPVFVVDAYTKRILSRHTILDHDASYEMYQKTFHAGLERNAALFNEFHALLVRVAKEFCRAKPICEGCPLGVTDRWLER